MRFVFDVPGGEKVSKDFDLTSQQSKGEGTASTNRLIFADPFGQFIFLFYNDTAAQHIGMATKKFSGGMEDQIDTQFKRSLNQWCGPCIITSHQDTPFVSRFANQLRCQ